MKQHRKKVKKIEKRILKIEDIKICHLKERKEKAWLKLRKRNETQQMK